MRWLAVLSVFVVSAALVALGWFAGGWLWWVLAVVVAALARQPGSDSPLPSITNSGPRGAAVLATWLREAGVEVVADRLGCKDCDR